MPLPLLVEPEDLLAQLENPQLLIVDCSRSEQYAQAHIPGSVHIPPAQLQSGIKPAAGKIPDPGRVSELLAGIGLQPEHHVVAVDDEGGGWAGRLLWTLECAGHQNYSMLNGGLVAWANEGHPLGSEVPTVTPSGFSISEFASSDRITIEELLQQLGNSDLGIWDARSRDEFLGNKSPAKRAGHIPGAAHLEWTDLMDKNRNLRLLAAEQIQTMLDERGLEQGKKLVTHCQSHHRSGLTWFAGKLLGYDIRAYDGSWGEWGNRDDTPIES